MRRKEMRDRGAWICEDKKGGNVPWKDGGAVDGF
jgi:hypothetical protein